MNNKFLILISLVVISFTRSNPICDHTNHVSAFLPVADPDVAPTPLNATISLLPERITGDTLTWKILNKLEYKEQEHEAYGTVMMPVFSKEVLLFQQKKVIIKGYILPVDRKTYALSKNVYAACFFCGKAGPETVMGLTFKNPPGRIKMDTYATLSGILTINGTDVEDWMYSLRDVEILYMKD